MLPGKTQLTQPTNTSKLALAFAKLSQKNTSDQGLTLLECLVAIGVIAVVVTAFTPQIFLAVATQIQNRRAEQALQLAQGEVDRVRRTVERGSYNDADLPPRGENNVRQQRAPGSTIANLPENRQYPVDPNQGRLIDVNGDGSNDFIVQTYRNQGTQRNGRTATFEMGVRVYAFTQNMEFESPPQGASSLKFTTAIGQQNKRPLAMIYTSVSQSDNRNSLCTYREFNGEGDRNAACQ